MDRPRYPESNQSARVIFTSVLLLLGATAIAVASPRSAEAARKVADGGAIPWSDLGAKAGAEYRGDGLLVSATESGARLRCAFQNTRKLALVR